MHDLNIKIGQRVRLVFDSSSIGIFTGKIKKVGDMIKYQIQFTDRYQYVPEDQLEILLEGPEHPIDLLETGKLSYTKELRRVLAQVRLNGKLVDLIYSMEISNTDFYAYQFKPVLKLLNSPNNGILIADEVGLGKTIEAGLIWTELKSRFDLRNLLILCPAILREKWQLELYNRFGIFAEILGARDLLKKLKNAYSFNNIDGFAIISSMQGLRSAKELANFIDSVEFSEPLIDCLIIDEAHYLRNPETKTAKLGRLLRNITDYIILLSATPIQLRSDDLFQLVNLIDNSTFRSKNDFINILQANAPIIKARDLILKHESSPEIIIELLKETQYNPLLKNSKQLPDIIKRIGKIQYLTSDQRVHLASKLEAINLFGNVLSRTRKREVTEWRVIREPIDLPIKMNKIEENFYEFVTNSVREYCSNYDQHEGFLLTTPQRQMSSSMAAAVYNWKKRLNFNDYDINEDFGVDPNFEPAGDLISDLIFRLQDFTDEKILYENDTKYIKLKEIINKYITAKIDEKIIIFSYFRATLFYLQERLKRDGILSTLIIGGMKESKTELIDKFRNDKKINILLSSEVGSEGIDIQFCRILINYDLPWNPMKVEQRIGRIDRLGQKAEKIKIINIFYDNTIDSRIYERLYKRLRIFQNALGDLEGILGEKIRNLSFQLLNTNLTKEQELQRIEQTALAVENIKKQEEDLEKDAVHLVAHGDYILNQIKSAKELNRWINDKDLQIYVIDFFKLFYPGSQFIQLDNNIFEILLPNNARNDIENYIKSQKIPVRTNLTSISAKPFKYIFKNKLVTGLNKNIEVINQIHPVIRFINNYYMNSHSQKIQQYPAIAIQLKETIINKLNLTKGIYLFSIQKWIVEGLQYVEKLDYNCYSETSSKCLNPKICEKLINAAVNYGTDWLEARISSSLVYFAKKIEENCIALSDKNYKEYILDLQNQNDDRAQVQIENLRQHFNYNKKILEQVKYNHIINNRDSLAKATEGKINALKNRVERRLYDIEKARVIRSKKEEICVGAIKII